MSNTPTINSLIALLEDLRDEHGGETPVQIQYQPSYPLKADIHGLVCEHDIAMAAAEDELAEANRYADDEDDEIDTSEVEWPEPEPVVYILATEGVGYGEHPYGDQRAWDLSRRW